VRVGEKAMKSGGTGDLPSAGFRNKSQLPRPTPTNGSRGATEVCGVPTVFTRGLIDVLSRIYPAHDEVIVNGRGA